MASQVAIVLNRKMAENIEDFSWLSQIFPGASAKRFPKYLRFKRIYRSFTPVGL
jgi:hypothetical protein